MLHFSRGKTIAILLTCLYGILMALPNLVPHWFPDEKTTRNWPFFVPHRTVPLGLDLQGGSHLVLALDEQVQKARRLGMDQQHRPAALVLDDEGEVHEYPLGPGSGDRPCRETKEIA